MAGKLCTQLNDADVAAVVQECGTQHAALSRWPEGLRGPLAATKTQLEVDAFQLTCKQQHPDAVFMYAFHATKEDASRDSILRNGFDPAKRGQVNGQYLGPGEYFSVKPGVVQMYGKNVIVSLICLTEGEFSYHPFSGIIAVRQTTLSLPVGWFENKKDNSAVLQRFKARHQALAQLKPTDFIVVPNDPPTQTASNLVPVACPRDENCPVCLDSTKASPMVELPSCRHQFHASCIEGVIQSKKLLCPMCRTPFGLSIGDQPDGHMGVYVARPGELSLDGYDGVGTIIIRYAIRGTANFTGTWRQAFLPDTPEGQEVLELLKRAWQQKLIFTVGTSLTTGQQNTVVWAGIHHKTSMSGGAARFGFPDADYLTRVKSELAQHGIVPISGSVAPMNTNAPTPPSFNVTTIADSNSPSNNSMDFMTPGTSPATSPSPTPTAC